jgi:hypothetical protein
MSSKVSVITVGNRNGMDGHDTIPVLSRLHASRRVGRIPLSVALPGAGAASTLGNVPGEMSATGHASVGHIIQCVAGHPPTCEHCQLRRSTHA